MKRMSWTLLLALIAALSMAGTLSAQGIGDQTEPSAPTESPAPAEGAGSSDASPVGEFVPPTGEAPSADEAAPSTEDPALSSDGAPEASEEPQATEPALPESQAAEDFYANGPGDSIFSIQLGANLPLFFQKLSDSSVTAPNLGIGPLLSLRWMAFIAQDFAIGGELGAGFNISLRNRVLFSVPLTFELMWMPVKMPFEIPLGIGLGGILYRMDDYTFFPPVIRPTAGLYWRGTPSWSFGGTLSYDWVPMIASWNDDISYYGNFLTLKLSALYHL